MGEGGGEEEEGRLSGTIIGIFMKSRIINSPFVVRRAAIKKRSGRLDIESNFENSTSDVHLSSNRPILESRFHVMLPPARGLSLNHRA